MARAARARERDRVRHGRHDREGVADRERRRLARPRVRGRRLALGRQPADARQPASCSASRRSTSPRSARAAASIAWLDPAGGLQVGPRSAGADPGPGLLRPRRRRADRDRRERRPRHDSRRRGRRRSDHDLARAGRGGGRPASPARSGSPWLEAARGIHELANARMTRALRAVSSEKGRDPREFALIAYGGSGPVHAGGLAEELGVLDDRRPAPRRAVQCRRPALRPPRVPRRSLLPSRRRHGRPRGRDCAAHGDARSLSQRPSQVGTSRPGHELPTFATAARAGRSRSALPPGPVDRRSSPRSASASRTSTSGSTASAGSPARRSRCGRCALPRSGRRPRRSRSMSPRHRCPTVMQREACGWGTRSPTFRWSPAPRSERSALTDRCSWTSTTRPSSSRPAWTVRRHSRRERSCSRRGRVVIDRSSSAPDPVTLQIVANALAVDRRRDGDDDLPHRALHRRARRHGLLGRALRRARRDGRPGRQRPVPSRLDPDRDRLAPAPLRREDAPRRRLHHERPVRRGHAPAGHLHRQAGASRGDPDRVRRHDRAPRRRRRAPARARAPATTPRSSRRASGCRGSGSTRRASRSRRCTG